MRKVHDWYRLLYLEPPVNTWKLYMLGLTMGAERDSLELVCRRLRFSDRELREFLALRDLLGESLARLMTWAETQSSMSDIYFALDPLPVEGVLFLMARSRREIMRKNISQYLTRLRTQELLIDGSDLKIMGLKNAELRPRCCAKYAGAIDGAAVTRDKQVELAKSLIRGLEPGGSGTAEPQTAKKPRHQ